MEGNETLGSNTLVACIYYIYLTGLLFAYYAGFWHVISFSVKTRKNWEDSSMVKCMSYKPEDRSSILKARIRKAGHVGTYCNLRVGHVETDISMEIAGDTLWWRH